MAHDFEVEDGLTFGEWLKQEIEELVFIERNGFFVDQVDRVATRLQADRPIEDRLEVLIPWSPVPTAFTAPGRYIYFNRRLLERCPTDEVVAFVVAHEIAHHDLGHLTLIHGPLTKGLASLGLGAMALAVFRSLQSRLYGPEDECAADRAGLDLCIRAGYDAEKCLRLFHVFEQIALDLGDIEAVYGLEEESDSELSPDAPFMTKARIWLWQRHRGYLPIQDREAELRRYLQSLGAAA